MEKPYHSIKNIKTLINVSGTKSLISIDFCENRSRDRNKNFCKVSHESEFMYSISSHGK